MKTEKRHAIQETLAYDLICSEPNVKSPSAVLIESTAYVHENRYVFRWVPTDDLWVFYTNTSDQVELIEGGALDGMVRIYPVKKVEEVTTTVSYVSDEGRE